MSQVVRYLLPAAAVVGLVYHMAAVIYPLQSSTEHLNTHLAFALVLLLLQALKKNPKEWPVLVPMLLLTLGVTGYVKLYYWELEARYGILTSTDLVIAVTLIVLVFETCRRSMGWPIPIVTGVFLAFMFLGPYLPRGLFRIAATEPADVVSMMTFQFGGAGIYGTLLEVSAYFVILFTVMGGIMQSTTAATFFRDLSLLASRKLRGGPALMAVVGSALMGTVTGATTANIVMTGSFTIPMMKKAGYAPEEAAGIEAAASNGGQIMPPVMGAAAFVMAMVTGIKYATIMLAAVIPAILYFLTLGLYVQLLAMKRKIPLISGDGGHTGELWKSMPSFVLVMGVIVYLFVQGFSAMYVAFWATIVSLALAVVNSRSRAALAQLVENVTSGMVAAAVIAVSLAAIGIVVKVITATGLGIKVPQIVETLSGGNVGLALVLTAFVCLVLGMGVPTTPAYILTAIVAGPVLTKLGVPLLPAHFFVFYFAVMALITPPVAAAAIVSSQIAGATYTRTAMEAVKASVAGFLIPFLVLSNPVFLMQPGGGLLAGLTALLMGLIMALTTSVTTVGHYMRDLEPWERFLSFVVAAGSFAFLVFSKSYLVFAAVLVLFLVLTLVQLRGLALARGGWAMERPFARRRHP